MFIYTIGILVYALGVYVVSLFNRKARLMVQGHKKIYPLLKEKVDPSARYLWFHASSLGEFEQGRPIIEAVRKRYPQYKILLTFFSPSGYEVRKDYSGADIVCYMPFDLVFNVRRFLNLVPLEAAFLIKYEFWPNFLRGLHRRGVRTYSVSSIFRPDQYIFKKYGAIMQRTLRRFQHIYVQDQRSADLLAGIGVTQVSVVGDVRCDRVLQIASEASPIPLLETFADGHQVFIAGSSWPADEDVYLPLFLKKPQWKLIIASHEIKPERLIALEQRLQGQGRRTVRLSALTEKNAPLADAVIVDCFGKLSSIYRYGTIAYIGGGFGVGIHNTLEAAVYGIPVIFGPNNKRFREAQKLKDTGGGFEVADTHSLQMVVDKFISDPTFLKATGQKARDYVLQGAGTTETVIESLNL